MKIVTPEIFLSNGKKFQQQKSYIQWDYGLFPLQDLGSDSNSDTDSYTMQIFPLIQIQIGSDSDNLIEVYVIQTEICPQDRDLSLKWVQYPFGKENRI